jgi:hypothetical protein
LSALAPSKEGGCGIAAHSTINLGKTVLGVDLALGGRECDFDGLGFAPAALSIRADLARED